MGRSMRLDPYAHAPKLPEGDSIDPRLVLGSGERPVELEIGPGRGWFLIERLEAFAEVFILGLEIRRKWAQIVDERVKSRGLGGRGRVFAEDARAAVARFPEACVSAIYVHFPDPWWKKRHQKRLVVSGDYGSALARVLVPGGELFVQTDVEERAQEYAQLLDATAELEPFAESPWIEDHPYVARSPRERRAMADGLPIYRLRYRRRGGAGPLVPVASSPNPSTVPDPG